MPSTATAHVDICPGPDATLGAILGLLRERTGTDFSRYRLSTIKRRIANRMISIGASTLEHYLGILQANESEWPRLLERVTIKVSRFYRNPLTFDALRQQVIPELIKERAGGPLRVWSAGCGCGEEAYTLAMLLDEAGAAGIVEATDIDPAALESARTGRYPESAFAELPRVLRERYIQVENDRGAVCDALRRRVRFSHHDLTSGAAAPGGGAAFDLVCCRNVLIYFEREIQERALREVRRSVRDGGFLCLGEAEWPMPSLAASLESLAHKTRLFRATDPDATWTKA